MSQFVERLMFLGIIALGAIGAFFYIEHLGAQKCLQNVEKANVKEEKKEEKQHTTDIATVQHEGKQYAEETSAPITPAPVVRLCPKFSSKAVPSAPAPRSKADGKSQGGGDDTGEPAFWDSKPVVQAGHDADAQIRGLQDYILNVCRPK